PRPDPAGEAPRPRTLAGCAGPGRGRVSGRRERAQRGQLLLDEDHTGGAPVRGKAEPGERCTGPFYHATRAVLAPGELLTPGHTSNYADPKLSWIYFSGTLDAAIWGCELAKGEGRERIYIVAPTGAFEDDPNLTDKRFPGNPTKSYRSREPLR